METVFLRGFATSAALIVAIGAQNAFVLRQGLQRAHVLPVVLVCALSDMLLITLGVAGLGRWVQAHPALLVLTRWGGAAFLIAYGLLAARTGGRVGQAEGSERLRLEQLQLLGVALQRLARLGGQAGAAAADQHAAQALLQPLDALAHRRGRDVQRARRRVEAAFAQHRGERGELAGIELHQFG